MPPGELEVVPNGEVDWAGFGDPKVRPKPVFGALPKDPNPDNPALC